MAKRKKKVEFPMIVELNTLKDGCHLEAFREKAAIRSVIDDLVDRRTQLVVRESDAWEHFKERIKKEFPDFEEGKHMFAVSHDSNPRIKITEIK